eukprot:720297-Heterocapsa_arctica.AAC.1
MQKGIASWTGKAFWDVLSTYRLAKNAYHHGEPNRPANITWLWDQLFLRIYVLHLQHGERGDAHWR